MWRKLYQYARELLDLKEQTDRNTAELHELREEFKQLSEAVRELYFEVRRMRENEVHEREKLVLRLENMLLRSGRGLPPGDDRDRGKDDNPSHSDERQGSEGADPA